MTPLRKRLIEDMTVRNFAPATQATYVQQVSLFARHFGQSPETLGPDEIRSYQVYLAMEKELAPRYRPFLDCCALSGLRSQPLMMGRPQQDGQTDLPLQESGRSR